MVERSPGRVLAPLALVAFAVALALAVATAGGGSPRVPATSEPAAQAPPPRPTQREYLVRPGDNLSIIAERTGVSVERLQELNADLDPQSLTPGQRLKLHP